jgi:transcriptional regulator with XRE-family HTH domain
MNNMKEYENLRYVIGQIVHYQRTSKGWTQQQLADATELKRTTISNIEAGRQSLALEQFCLIMDVMGANPGSALETGLRRLRAEDRWRTVEKVVTSSNVHEKAIRKHILDALK